MSGANSQHGVVSVVVLNYQGASDTITCIEGLKTLDWPESRLEIVVVDNASGGDDVERIRRAFPDVQLVESEENLGFAGGCNLGAKKAGGEYVAFLNNDARPDPQWLTAAIAVLERDSTIGCVASKVLDWEGKKVDFVDGALSYYGHAFKLHVGEPDTDQHADESDVLFATGAAMICRAQVFANVGGFDDRYFMFFEDVDLGWRLWLLGWKVRYVPDSVAFHRHHASASRLRQWREHYLLERNALFTIYKNYDDDNLTKILPAALALAVRRGVVLGGDDPHALDLGVTQKGPQALKPGEADAPTDTAEVSKQTLAAAYAVNAFVEALPELEASRQAVQKARQRTDAEILRLFRRPLLANVGEAGFKKSFDSVTSTFGIAETFSERHKIVIATGDTLTPKMAGPAIRAWEMARALSREHDVELVTVGKCSVSHPRFTVRSVNDGELRRLEKWCDIFIFQGFLMHEHPFLRASNKVIVVDVYDPFHLEQLEQARDKGEAFRRQVVHSSTAVLNDQLMRGDFFMCASDKQRDFWLGQMSGLGRVNSVVYDEDETLLSLIDVVPFGVPDTPPQQERSAIKGAIPGIGKDDKVILWGGGIYNWFDPLTLIRAVDQVRRRRDDVRLFFLGTRHPNPHVPEMRMAVAARDLASELGILDTHVFFNEDWVAYEDRHNYMCDADIGVSTHLDHVETAFSFRTRILDYLWTSLPIVATRGDALADLIEREHLGLTVPAGDVDALADALFRVIDDEELNGLCRKNVARIAPDMSWSKALAPLLEFCRNPRRAPDLMDPEAATLLRREMSAIRRKGGLRHELNVALWYLRNGGVRTLADVGRDRLRRQLG
jgi:GT2 family glycosyltransferase/glycosyltransferase involved in cell wall biosynthesis